MCSSLLQLTVESCDLSQAEKKITVRHNLRKFCEFAQLVTAVVFFLTLR